MVTLNDSNVICMIEVISRDSNNVPRKIIHEFMNSNKRMQTLVTFKINTEKQTQITNYKSAVSCIYLPSQ